MTTRYTADVTHQSVRPNDADAISYGAFTATDPYTAARMVANWAAERRYGDEGTSAHMAQVGENKFLAMIGTYALRDGWGVTTGTTVNITLTEET